MNDDRGFNLDRAYLGYQYDLSKELQLKVVADFGQSKSVDDHQRIGFVKNAQISWKREKWTLHAGLISTTQFKFQESFWGKRYVMNLSRMSISSEAVPILLYRQLTISTIMYRQTLFLPMAKVTKNFR